MSDARGLMKASIDGRAAQIFPCLLLSKVVNVHVFHCTMKGGAFRMACTLQQDGSWVCEDVRWHIFWVKRLTHAQFLDKLEEHVHNSDH